MASELEQVEQNGWRLPRGSVSLPEVHASIPIPADAGFWRKLFAFAGPGYLVAVGYMDPGNWATDLAGGARYGYALLSVILLSNLMAILLQALAVRLGIATGRDLAQACRDHYSWPVTVGLWILCEIAIAACDLAEVIGAAIALNLLFGLPLIWGVCLTALDVLIVLFLQNRGFRYVEALVVALIFTIAGCFAIELWLAKPDPAGVAAGFLPTADILRNGDMLYIAIGILGATVMPHNLYLHSSIVQTRKYVDTFASKREAIRFASLDSSVALMFALFINAAILVMSAATFNGSGHENVADIGDVDKMQLGADLPGELPHVVQDCLVGGRMLDGDENAAVHRYANVCTSNHALSAAMITATAHDSTRIATGATNGPILALSDVNITSGKTANDSCRLSTT